MQKSEKTPSGKITNHNLDSKNETSHLMPYAAVCALFTIFTVTILYFIWPIDLISLNNAGILGDSFGSLNTLFSGLALAALITTIRYQQKQIRTQQDEIDKQTKLFDQQKFDETFFNLLKLLRENLNQLKHKDEENGDLHGIDALQHRLKLFRSKIRISVNTTFPEDEDERVVYAWNFLKISTKSLGNQRRYTDTLGMIIEWIETKCPKENEKENYREILSSQLTQIECNYLFYQAMMAPKHHPLRNYLDIDNNIFSKIAQSNSSAEHRKMFSWVTKSKEITYKKTAVVSIDKNELARAKRRLKAKATNRARITSGKKKSGASMPTQ